MGPDYFAFHPLAIGAAVPAIPSGDGPRRHKLVRPARSSQATGASQLARHMARAEPVRDATRPKGVQRTVNGPALEIQFPQAATLVRDESEA